MRAKVEREEQRAETSDEVWVETMLRYFVAHEVVSENGEAEDEEHDEDAYSESHSLF